MGVEVETMLTVCWIPVSGKSNLKHSVISSQEGGTSILITEGLCLEVRPLRKLDHSKNRTMARAETPTRIFAEKESPEAYNTHRKLVR
jgi:hypothetical protein